MRDSVAQGGASWKYIQRKLEGCLTQSIFTLEKYKTYEAIRDHNKKRGNNSGKHNRDPNYANFDQREYKEEDLEKFYYKPEVEEG
jgi:DNA replication protein DnaD